VFLYLFDLQLVPDVGDEFSVEEVDGPLGHSGVLLGVCDHHDGSALPVEFAEQFHDLLAILGIEVTRRLVDKVEALENEAGVGLGMEVHVKKYYVGPEVDQAGVQYVWRRNQFHFREVHRKKYLQCAADSGTDQPSPLLPAAVP